MALKNWADIWGDIWGDIWALDSDPDPDPDPPDTVTTQQGAARTLLRQKLINTRPNYGRRPPFRR